MVPKVWEEDEVDDLGAINSTTTTYECSSSTPPNVVQPDTTKFVAMTSTWTDVNTVAPAAMHMVKHDVVDAFSVRLCYCGDYAKQSNDDKCNDEQEFPQAWGVLYYWRTSICDYGNALSDCSAQPYLQVIPHQKFTLKIECPPGAACLATDDNRVRFLNEAAVNDKPSWDANKKKNTLTKSWFLKDHEL